MHLLRPDGGTVRLGDANLSSLTGRELRRRRRRLRMVFQDPYSSLNPRCEVGEQIRRDLGALP